MSLRKFFCTFPQNLIQEPIISHTLWNEYGVVPNIRAASITDQLALVAIEIEGNDDDIERAVEYLRERGVAVEELAEGESPEL